MPPSFCEGWFACAFRVSRSPAIFVNRQDGMIEAVIWDFGGVLTTSPFEAFARYETERGLPADIIRRTNAANHLENAWAKFERAEVDIAAFDQLFAAESLALAPRSAAGTCCRCCRATCGPKWSKRSSASSQNSR